MTEEEILRNRYISLQNGLYRVRNKIRTAITEYNDLFSLVKSGIMIDNEADGYNEFEKINKNLISINNDLSNEVIPRVNNKI